MHNSYVTIPLRTPLAYDCTTYPYACACPSSSSIPRTASACCFCVDNSICRFPKSPSYCYNLYGLRQSSLIQWSPYRRAVPSGFDRCCYTRVRVHDADTSYRRVNSNIRQRISRDCIVRDKGVAVRRFGVRKRMVFEEMRESCDLGFIDEAEALLSLLADDIDDDFFHVRKEDKSLIRKKVLKKRQNVEICHEYGSRKKRLGSDTSEIEHGRGAYGSVVISSTKKDDWIRKKYNIRGKGEALLIEENNRKQRSRKECNNTLSKNRVVAREREVIDASLSEPSVHNDNTKQERESMLRNEDWEAKTRRQEGEDLLMRKEEQRQKLRREGSSGTSYYSLSSTGDYESENDNGFIREGRRLEDSSCNYKSDSRINGMVYQKAEEENRRYKDYKEENEVSSTKTSTAKVKNYGSNVVESNFRKQSEKKLADMSIEEVDLRNKTSHKDEKLLMAHDERSFKKSSDYYSRNNEEKVRLTQSAKIDVERMIQQRRQMVDEVSRQRENKMKYKRFLEMQEACAHDVRNSYIDKACYGKSEMSSQFVITSRGDAKEHQTGVGVSIREDEYQSASHRVIDVTKIQEIDIRRTSVTDQRFQTCAKEENVITSMEQQKYDQLSETTGKIQNLLKKEDTSIFKEQSDYITNQEETVNVEDKTKTKSEVLVKPSSSNLQATATLLIESKVENSTKKVSSDGISRFDASALHELKLKRSPSLHHDPYHGDPNYEPHEQPSKFTSHEGSTEYAARLEKSSARYIGEFVEKVKNEISNSEIHSKHKSNKDKLELEKHQEQKQNLFLYISVDSQSKKPDSRRSDQHSGTEGYRDETWKVEEAVEELQVKGKSVEDGKASAKRSGRKLWNIISDVVLLRWSPRSEIRSSGKKTNGKSSPNQSTSSETWFSGHEAEINEDMSPEKETSILGLSAKFREENVVSKVEESSSSLTKGSMTSISFPSDKEITKGDFGTTSSMALVDSPARVPTLKLHRSPIVRGVSESGEMSTLDSGISEQPNTELTDSSAQVMDEEREMKLKKLRRKDQVVRNEFDEWEEAYRLESEQRKIDEMFMREALLGAEKAADNWEVPVGAVLVHNGKIIARGYNLVEELRDSTAHAEMACIRQGSNVLRTWRLSETALYVTLEPCPMCAGAILQARIDTIVWGAPNKLLGADGSWIRLFPSGDGGESLEQSDKPPAPVHPFHTNIVIRRGVLASECADMMQQFFKLRRNKKPESPPPASSCLPISHHRPSKLFTKMHGAFK